MFVTAVLAAQYTGALDVSDAARIALRNTVPANVVPISGGRQGADVIASDLAMLGLVRLHLKDPFWDYVVTYSPTITAPDVELGFEPQLLNSGTVSIGWHGRFVRVQVAEGASYGVLNSAFLYAAPNAATQTTPGGNAATGGAMAGGTTTPPTGQTTTGAPAAQTVAPPGNITYGSTNTAGTVSVQLRRRGFFTLSGAYVTGGGLTPSSKEILPEQYGPVGSAALGYSITRADTLSTVVSAGETTTSGTCPPPPGQAVQVINPPYCVIRTPYASAQETLRHALSGAMSLSLNLGVTAAIADTSYVHEIIIDPVILASFTDGLAARNTSFLTVALGFVPTVDIRTGLPTNRAQGTVTYAEIVAPRTTLTLTGIGVQSIPIPEKEPYPITSVSGGVEVTRRVDRQLDVDVGVTSLWQSQPGFQSVASTVAYVSVVGRLPTARF